MSTFQSPSRVPAELALPCGAIGFAGSFMAADFLRIGTFESDSSLRPMIVLVSTLGASLIGLLLGATMRLSAWKAAVLTVCSVLGAGLVGGAFIGVMAWSRYGVADGAASGFFCSAAFLPSFGAILAAARRVGRARPGSLGRRSVSRARARARPGASA